jgi:hypothetical protein
MLFLAISYSISFILINIKPWFDNGESYGEYPIISFVDRWNYAFTYFPLGLLGSSLLFMTYIATKSVVGDFKKKNIQ